jgi:hypothetical protein
LVSGCLDVTYDRKAAEIEIDPLNLAPIFLLEGLADRQLSDDDEIDSSAKQRWESIENYRPPKKTLEPVLGGADWKKPRFDADTEGF